ncbi:GPI inositol-deacylase-like [Topomyia yanbarensis]|uniref:GPI inositol-deacylase-like n=1 Tax=Topomyia yanbarensis TaxID=2498891 RepID=UPI00273A9702|nr:GPI inositol-deacylase-like [Topomyia yanbarensis]
MPNVWLSTDHVCIVWCLQFVLVVNRFLYSIVQRSDQANNKFIDNKSIKLQHAIHYFKDETLVSASQFDNDITKEDWIEDNRVHINHIFDRGLFRTRIQMITLNPNPLFKHMKADVINLNTREWIYGCIANVINKYIRYCNSVWSASFTHLCKWKTLSILFETITLSVVPESKICIKLKVFRKPGKSHVLKKEEELIFQLDNRLRKGWFSG